jgi:hypothetical protein
MQSTIYKSSQSTTQWNKVSKGRRLTSNTEALISLRVAGEEDGLPAVNTKAEEGDEPREYPIASFVAKTQDISQKIANTTKWPENLRRKTRSQEAVKYLTMCSITLVVKQ